MMVLQSIVFPDDYCTTKELFFNCDKTVSQSNGGITIPGDTRISFYSYMNNFDSVAWKRYAVFLKVQFYIEIKGTGTVVIKVYHNGETYDVKKHPYNNESFSDLQIDIDYEKYDGQFYFEVEANSDTYIRKAFFVTDERPCNEVKIALNICTYHRNEFLLKNLEQLKSSLFFKCDSDFNGKLSVMVVDNGSELECIETDNIKIVHNPNTGGSGGFARGLKEICAGDDSVTHIVFMDDDIKFASESLYRLYALLAYMKSEYKNTSIAGRMFRMDKPWIQYTAVEIWNGGDLRHIGWNADMTLHENIKNINDNTGAEYGGWWFCCFPMEFARENEPLPFFIHCDDVEYGLRHGQTPIILNGIQVWHETYEYRQSPVIAYYDTRNMLLTNRINGINQDKEYVLSKWMDKISVAHRAKDWLSEYMMILGFLDYQKGVGFIQQLDAEKYHKKLCMVKTNRYINAFFWRKAKSKYLRRKEI